jgi:hypothetical protein
VCFEADLEHTIQLNTQASIRFLIMKTARHTNLTDEHVLPSLFRYISIFPFQPIKKQLISIYKAISVETFSTTHNEKGFANGGY